MIEGNGDTIVSDFNIILNENNDYEFTVEGTSGSLRFKADVYGCRTLDSPEFKYYMKSASAQEIIDLSRGAIRDRHVSQRGQ